MAPKKRDALALLIILVLAILMFWPVTLGNKTLLPADNLFGFEPWQSFAEEWNATVPQNGLLSDLILENYAWKGLIIDSIQAGEIPLWNPYLFAGTPFMAAGQQSTMYPFSILFYLLPLAEAYGWFSALQVALAGFAMYFLARVLRINRLGSLIAAITYMFSGFYIVSVVFSMMIAAAIWLPAALACVELILRRNEERLTGGGKSAIPWIAFGAVALMLQFLAGHVEISVYSFIVIGLYSLWRLVGFWLKRRDIRAAGRALGHIGAMLLIGAGLGAIQWIPLYELVTQSFRQGSASYAEIVQWAYPNRQIATFLIPDFFGNPSHHGYWDIVSRQWTPITQNALGESIHTIFWGIKNYVEAGSYVGILPLFLAVIAAVGKRTRTVWFFAILAVASLLLVFGTPLYAPLYYLMPGFKQLHSPFRWVFPYTVSMAVLAGVGIDYLSSLMRSEKAVKAGWPRWLGRLAMAGGLAGLLVLAVSVVAPAPFIRMAQIAVDKFDAIPLTFPDGRAFYSYEFRNLLIFFSFLLASGIVLWLAGRPVNLPRRLGGVAAWKPLAVLAVTLELMIIGFGFNPAVDKDLLDFTPPVAEFLQEQKADGPFRLTTFNAAEEKTFNANVGMYYDLDDVRGYDSIITRQYVEYMNAIAPQDNELLYNRIAPIYSSQTDALDSRLLDLLNVRYVMTTHHIPNPGHELVYDGEVRVYENLDVLPRAFFVATEETLTREQVLDRLTSLEPTEAVWLETTPTPDDQAALAAGRATIDYKPADAIQITPNDVLIDLSVDGAGWLVLADSYFPGWKAYVRPLGDGEEDEVERTIYRADGNFRAIRVDAGEQTVRFTYTPMSFKLGLFVTFLAGVLLFLALAYYLWRKFYHEEEGEDATIKRVARNSLTPMILSLLNKGIDFAFAMLRLRILEPTGEGRYAFAIVFIGYFEILTLFGLGTLNTRDVSRDRSQANRYLSNSVILRVILWLISIPLMALVAYIYYRLGHLTGDTALAIGLFAVALFFSNISEALSSIFYAHERMEFPAGLSALTNVLKVSMGAAVLFVGWGFVGLAGVSVVGNILTTIILFVLVRKQFFHPRMESDAGFQREMMKTSYPLMINHLLATVFFRIDMLLLKPMRGDQVIGYYSAAYKYIDGLNIIPSYFTLAIFPMMSRFATSARDSLMKAYILSLRLLLMISLPIAAGTPFIARELILLLGGAKFLPHSVTALQLLIWFLPFSYVNSVTQYVLIAIDQQRYLTRAFLIGVSFNLIANLIFIPQYGYQAAAIITVLSEIALLIPFYYCVRKNLGPIPWVQIVWRPALASAAMAGVLWLTRAGSVLLRLPAAVVVYLGVLVLIGGFRNEDFRLLIRALPDGRLKQFVAHIPGLADPAG